MTTKDRKRISEIIKTLENQTKIPVTETYHPDKQDKIFWEGYNYAVTDLRIHWNSYLLNIRTNAYALAYLTKETGKKKVV